MIELIPAIDIIDGQCVRLTRGDYATQKVYDTDPVNVARRLQDAGFRRLHVVDLDGARSRHIVNADILRRITAATSLTVDFGGGIKTDDDLRRALDAGAAMVTVGSIAVTDPARVLAWLDTFGSERLVLGADVRQGRISINGWKEDSADELLPFLGRYLGAGMRHVLCTDISRDGMLQGPATDLYATVMRTYPACHLIASGGVAGIDDIRALDAAGIPAAVFGKAIYEGRLDLGQLLSEFPQ
ncbi:MAG: 1-(5-phosphoribosyl)-5-[Bacteroidaceae bacterium]|nr:1-(5-phosphoribosyl)-5-[(5-phosphoribosylamino)methylideneamino]imidazole-4-carboxamide isomerase [Bacteroidaceae bacterium]